jgi:uncharacterized protein (TIGR01777 family)
MQKVVISGGTGLIGSMLTNWLDKNKYQVFLLTRNPKSNNHIGWNPATGSIDAEKLHGTDIIIHLAGENIGAKRWSDAQKKLLYSSRLESTDLLVKALQKNNIRPDCIIAASGAGIYGNDDGSNFFTEEHPPGEGFAAELAAAWEKATDALQNCTARFYRLRIGVVLSSRGGALAKMLPIFQWGIGSAVGTGKQFLSWIHIDDLCRIMLEAMNNKLSPGNYNAVAPNPATNHNFSKTLAQVLHRWMLPLPVPPFMLSLLFGEMANLVLGGARVSSEKLLDQGFAFKHTNLKETLEDVITRQV